MFTKDKHSSLLCLFIKDKENKYYSVDTRGLYYKTLPTINLQEIDKFRIKIASSSLDKHTSLNKQRTNLLQSLYITNP